jgi:AcrR family transcriptional regulator
MNGVHFRRENFLARLKTVPYPAKTGREEILATAMGMLAREGLAGLSLRSLADELGLAPNALYRYFADRAALEAAMAAETARQLHTVLKHAAGQKEPEAALRSMTRAYLKFAHEQARLYEAMMPACDPDGAEAEAHKALWDFVVEQVARLAGERQGPEAAVALWALLHGLVGLENAGILDEAKHRKPRAGGDFGLEAWFAAARLAGIKQPA